MFVDTVNYHIDVLHISQSSLSFLILNYSFLINLPTAFVN
jgi:hypothetical protein